MPEDFIKVNENFCLLLEHLFLSCLHDLLINITDYSDAEVEEDNWVDNYKDNPEEPRHVKSWCLHDLECPNLEVS